MQFGLRLVVLISFLFPITSSAENNQVPVPAECAQSLASGTALIPTDIAPKFAGRVLILDTNVIINDPYVIYKYPGARIIIPGAVIPELNRHKKNPKTGHAAQAFSRIVDSLIAKYKNISKPAPLDAYGTTLMVDPTDHMHLMAGTSYMDPEPDNKIVAAALNYTYLETYGSVHLVSDDINARITASSLEVEVMGSEYDWVTVVSEDQKDETQIKRLRVTAEELAQFRATGKLSLPLDSKLLPNEFAMVQLDGEDKTEPTLENVVRYVYDREAPEKSRVKRLMIDLPELLAQPKNVEQAMALDVLFDTSVDLIVGESAAGTGKTFISMMAGLLQTRNMHKQSKAFYERMIVSRTLTQVGKVALGTLPGDEGAKLQPFNENYADAWDALMRATKKVDAPNRGAAAVLTQIDSKYHGQHPTVKKTQPKKNGSAVAKNAKPAYELLAFPNIRGRSINDSYIILDEAQNTSMHEIKSFLTRAGDGTKMVLLGDASQVDSPFLNEYNNGLKIVLSLIKTAPLSLEERSRIGVFKLTETVRSALADLAVKLFDSKVE